MEFKKGNYLNGEERKKKTNKQKGIDNNTIDERREVVFLRIFQAFSLMGKTNSPSKSQELLEWREWPVAWLSLSLLPGI